MSRKNVLYVLINDWADFEFAHLGASVHFFKELYRNVIVGLTKEPVISAGGLRVIPDTDIRGAREMEFDTLVLVGSTDWKTLRAPELEAFVKEAYSAGKTVAAICSASAYIGTLGLLNDVEHTVNDLKELKEWAGNAYTNEEGYRAAQCVHDRNVITANGSASLEFARDVMYTMKDIPREGVLNWYVFNKNGQFPA